MDVPKLIALTFGVGIFGVVMWLIRERRLKEKYSLLWLFTSIFIIILASSRQLLEFIAAAVGIYYPPSLLFLLGVIFLLVINITFSITLSRLSDANRQLTQEIALLRKELEEVKKGA